MATIEQSATNINFKAWTTGKRHN